MKENICCECGWTGSFEDIVKEYEQCCPTILQFLCPACGREMAFINTANRSPHVSVSLHSGAIFSLSATGVSEADKRAIPRLSEQDKRRISTAIKVACSNGLSGK